MLIGNNHTSQNTRRALTLVELTAVTVALAGLIGATLPTVRSAHDKSLEAGCRERLGKIAQAGLVYAAEDSGELAIPISVADAQTTQMFTSYYGFGGKSGLGPTRDANISIFGGSPAFKMGTMNRPLNLILYKRPFEPPRLTCSGRGGCQQNWNDDARRDLDLFHCPADNGFSGMHYRIWKESGLSSYDFLGTSYSANALAVTVNSLGKLASVSPYGRPLSRVPNPSGTIFFQEVAARFAIFANNPELDQTEGCWPYPQLGTMTAYGWHGVPFRFNVAFGDGHATVVDQHGYGRSPTPPFSSNCGSCQCLIVRGDGWQLDTLPSPFWPINKLSYTTGINSQDGDLASLWEIVQ